MRLHLIIEYRLTLLEHEGDEVGVVVVPVDTLGCLLEVEVHEPALLLHVPDLEAVVHQHATDNARVDWVESYVSDADVYEWKDLL